MCLPLSGLRKSNHMKMDLDNVVLWGLKGEEKAPDSTWVIIGKVGTRELTPLCVRRKARILNTLTTWKHTETNMLHMNWTSGYIHFTIFMCHLNYWRLILCTTLPLKIFSILIMIKCFTNFLSCINTTHLQIHKKTSFSHMFIVNYGLRAPKNPSLNKK